jgi:hypothetical protein
MTDPEACFGANRFAPAVLLRRTTQNEMQGSSLPSSLHYAGQVAPGGRRADEENRQAERRTDLD